MPKISDEKRAARRTQILEAAWTCFQKQGLHATTMGDIIATAGLSAGAVYSYFPSKDELILAAVTTSLGGVTEKVAPLFQATPPLPPDLFIEQLADAITQFTARDGYDLRRLALLGWAEAQRNAPLRETMRRFYLAFLDQLAGIAAEWRRSGRLAESAAPPDVAKALLALALGFVVESAVIGDVDPQDLGRGMRALLQPRPVP